MNEVGERLGNTAEPLSPPLGRAGMSSRKRSSTAAPPSQPGRPRKPAATKRSGVIGVRVSEEERIILERNADGQQLSAFLRQTGLGQRRPGRIPRAHREIAGQLSRIGNNLNQLVRLAHTGRFPAHLEGLLQRIFREIVKWRREVFGQPE